MKHMRNVSSMVASLRRTSSLAVALFAVAAAVLAGCSGDDDAPADGTSVAVGTLSDSGGLVSVVSDGTTFVAYLCDGASVAAFFTGPISDGSFEAMNVVGSFAGSVESGAVVGTFTPVGGMEEAFSGAVVGTSEGAGIWQAFPGGEESGIVAGWVVDGAGQQRGATVDRMTGAVLANPTLDVATGTATTAQGAVNAAHVVSPNGYINAYLR